jgi:integrase
MKLSEFFESTYLVLRITGKLDPKTEKSYRESVKWWVKITGDPPLDQITSLDAAKFVAELGKQKGKRGPVMERSSVGKHCVNLNSILSIAGPSSQNRLGQDLIQRVPFFDAPRVDKDPPEEDWEVEEIRAMYSAAHVARLPKIPDVSPREWWEAFIPFEYSTGIRITASQSVEFENLRGQWLTVLGKVSKGGRGKKQWVRADVLEKVESIRRPGRTKIFGWPNWEKQRRVAYDQLRRIQAAAGIPENRRWGFQSFRKTYTTQIASGGLDPQQGLKTAQAAVGHTSLSITTGHYISGSVQDRLVAAAIDAMESPFPQVDRANPKPTIAEPIVLVDRTSPKEPPSEREWRRSIDDFID